MQNDERVEYKIIYVNEQDNECILHMFEKTVIDAKHAFERRYPYYKVISVEVPKTQKTQKKEKLSLIDKEEIKASHEFMVLAINIKPPLQVLLWLEQTIARKMNIEYHLVHNFIEEEIYSKGL